MTCIRFDRPSTTSDQDRSDLLATFDRAARAGEDAALARLSEAAPPALGLDVILAYRADEERRVLAISFGHGIDMPTYHALGALAYGEFICGRIARDRRMAVIAEIGDSTDPACAACKRIGIQAYVGVPLLRGVAGISGIVGFGSLTRTRFSEADVDLFVALAERIRVLRAA
jgi:GAF domain-containing protein